LKHPRAFWIAALLCLTAAVASSVDFTALKPQGYVSDFANVVDAGSRSELEQFCAMVEKSTGAQMAIVTLPSLEGDPVEDVANALYRKWGVGRKGADEGVLLLLSIRDRRSRLEVGYGLEPIITDGDAGEILRAMRPYLRESQYGPALLEAAREIGARIAQGKGVALQQPAQTRRQARPSAEPRIPVGLIIGGIILFALLSGITGGRGGRRRNRGGFGGILPGLILGNMLGRTFDHRHGGGGFGGFDSGGSFGGFGGGDSGGGGASSSW
jgi:uncharacterized protein